MGWRQRRITSIRWFNLIGFNGYAPFHSISNLVDFFPPNFLIIFLLSIRLQELDSFAFVFLKMCIFNWNIIGIIIIIIIIISSSSSSSMSSKLFPHQNSSSIERGAWIIWQSFVIDHRLGVNPLIISVCFLVKENLDKIGDDHHPKRQVGIPKFF